jgi:hypothetical protein
MPATMTAGMNPQWIAVFSGFWLALHALCSFSEMLDDLCA